MMATIEKRTTQDGSVSYRVKVRMKGFPVQSASFARKTDAAKWASATESAIREGRHFEISEAKKRTLSDLIAKYRAEVLPRLRSAETRAIHLDWWASALGDYTLADIRPPRILEARKTLADKPTPRGTRLSPSTINRYCSTLSHCFSWAMKELQWVNDNPLMKIRPFKEPPGITRFLSDAERDALLAAAKAQGNDLYFILVLLLSTGARRNEIMRLRWPEVNFKQGTVTFLQTKSGKVRHVPVTGTALQVLKDLAAERKLKNPQGLVFPGTTAATKDKPLAIENIFRAALKSAGIEEKTRIHDLRHSAGSYMVMAGIDLRTVQEILGHHSVTVTERYAHLARAHVEDASGKLDKAMFGGGQ
jgi:site-specific recombinase XerD